MEKKELLASWTYTGGELARQRWKDNLPVIGFVVGLLIIGILAWPLFLSSSPWISKAGGWLIVRWLLVTAGGTAMLVSGISKLREKLYKKVVPASTEEVVITSEKIITERKTWLLSGGQRRLTGVEYEAGRTQDYIVFRGVESRIGKRERRFVVKLPVPLAAREKGELVCRYFSNRLKKDPATG